MEENDSKRRKSQTGSMKIKGTVVLMKKNLEGLMDFSASIIDGFHEMFGRKVSLQLINAVTLEDVPGPGRLHFICNSWVYPAQRYKKDRIFLTDKAYLPAQTPPALQNYREEELELLGSLRNGTGSMIIMSTMIYQIHNKGPEYVREILGG